MYLITYTNVFDVAHIHFTEERVYMALAMGAGMGVVMMGWMWGMYANRRWNVGVIAGSGHCGQRRGHHARGGRGSPRALVRGESVAQVDSFRSAGPGAAGSGA